MSRSTVLFICTGNYYRSRFAESLFNWLAVRHGLRWKANSRGLHIHPGNVGPIFRHARERLQSLGIVLEEPLRYPRDLDEEVLELADHIIALKELEHRPMLDERFPEWADRVEYWEIDDLDVEEPCVALPKLEVEVRGLVERLMSCSISSLSV